MAFQLPDLPYDQSALEPEISAETLQYHHGKHHAAYVSKANAAIDGTDLDGRSLEDVIRAARDKGDQGLLNNASQIWNHTFYWNSLSAAVSEPSAPLKAAIDKAFGGMDAFKDAFKQKGATHFGSGWVWLVADSNGEVSVRDTHDEASILPGDDGLTPLLVCDVWEHAFYVDRRNDKPAYLDAVLNKLFNWDLANAQYEAAKSGGGAWTHP